MFECLERGFTGTGALLCSEQESYKVRSGLGLLCISRFFKLARRPLTFEVLSYLWYAFR